MHKFRTYHRHVDFPASTLQFASPGSRYVREVIIGGETHACAEKNWSRGYQVFFATRTRDVPVIISLSSWTIDYGFLLSVFACSLLFSAASSSLRILSFELLSDRFDACGLSSSVVLVCPLVDSRWYAAFYVLLNFWSVGKRFSCTGPFTGKQRSASKDMDALRVSDMDGASRRPIYNM